MRYSPLERVKENRLDVAGSQDPGQILKEGSLILAIRSMSFSLLWLLPAASLICVVPCLLKLFQPGARLLSLIAPPSEAKLTCAQLHDSGLCSRVTVTNKLMGCPSERTHSDCVGGKKPLFPPVFLLYSHTATIYLTTCLGHVAQQLWDSGWVFYSLTPFWP